MRAKAPLGGLGGLNAVGCLLTAKDIRQQSLDLQSKTLLYVTTPTQLSDTVVVLTVYYAD